MFNQLLIPFDFGEHKISHAYEKINCVPCLDCYLLDLNYFHFEEHSCFLCVHHQKHANKAYISSCHV